MSRGIIFPLLLVITGQSIGGDEQAELKTFADLTSILDQVPADALPERPTTPLNDVYRDRVQAAIEQVIASGAIAHVELRSDEPPKAIPTRKGTGKKYRVTMIPKDQDFVRHRGRDWQVQVEAEVSAEDLELTKVDGAVAVEVRGKLAKVDLRRQVRYVPNTTGSAAAR
jgi:hypothetical protein